MSTTSPTPCPSCDALEARALAAESALAEYRDNYRLAFERVQTLEAALAEVTGERDRFADAMDAMNSEALKTEADRDSALARVVALEGALTDLFRWGVTHDVNDTAAWERARALLQGAKP